MAIAAGAHALGLVAQMVSGPGIISDALIRNIAAHIHENHGHDIWTVLLTSCRDKVGVLGHIRHTGVNSVQLVDYPQAGVHQAIQNSFPDLRIIQTVHVENEGAIDMAIRQAEIADYILLDSGKPSAVQKTFGGTGKTHDWAISRKIVERLDKPVFLAGGLNPDNVQSAVRAVRPFGVDLCSGLRDRDNNYVLIPEKTEAFAAALRAI